MHETILKTVTVGIVSGLFVYWLTSPRKVGGKSAPPKNYSPLTGDIRRIPGGTPSAEYDRVEGGLPTNCMTYNALASDYLYDPTQIVPATSCWNIGISLQCQCRDRDLQDTVKREETASSFPIGVKGFNDNPVGGRYIKIPNCNPNICVPVCCVEIV
jgi:hypothetical protein